METKKKLLLIAGALSGMADDARRLREQLHEPGAPAAIFEKVPAEPDGGGPIGGAGRSAQRLADPRNVGRA